MNQTIYELRNVVFHMMYAAFFSVVRFSDAFVFCQDIGKKVVHRFPYSYTMYFVVGV